MQQAISIMDSRPIICNYCRQRIWMKPNESPVVCPGCELEQNGRSKMQDSERFSREKCPIVTGSFPSINLMRKKNPGSPKMSTSSSLNVKPSPLQLPPSSRPNKRALLCGVTYNNEKYKLKGTINDVKNMRETLRNTFGFQEHGILVLTEDEAASEHIPTRKNIKRALEWLVEGCRRGDSLVFYFSGHGLRQPDFNGDEIDGFDETICPVDFMKEGMILDNEINSTIVQPLPEGVTLHAIVDACHSGTILDLLYVYNRKKRVWEDNRPPSGVNKATSGGTAICISACEDNQVAADTSALTGKTMNGAMTYIFVEIVKHNPGLTYGDLLDLIQETIDDLNQNGCLRNTNFLRKLFGDRISQRALLSASEKFDVYQKPFRL